MKPSKTILICSTILVIFSGCAYRHYLGVHGPSIKIVAEIHEGITADEDCLSCHHPDHNPTGPPTSHPQFTGCLECHNDDI